MAEPVIREARASDFEAWLPLWRGYNAFYGRPDFPEAITRTTWARFLDPSEPMHALVADDGGRLLGLAHYLFHRSTTLVGPTCYLQDLYTVGAARRRGVARALLEAVRARAVAGGAQRLYWQTHETNQTARRLYDKLATNSGFVVYRIEL